MSGAALKDHSCFGCFMSFTTNYMFFALANSFANPVASRFFYVFAILTKNGFLFISTQYENLIISFLAQHLIILKNLIKKKHLSFLLLRQKKWVKPLIQYGKPLWIMQPDN